jgi:hypothetical protein
MASELKVDKFTGVTTAGSIDVTGEGNSTTTNLQQGLAKVFINFNGTGTIATRDSFNTSSIADLGTGNYRVVYNNNMGNFNYTNVLNCNNTSNFNGMFGSTDNAAGGEGGLNTTSQIEFFTCSAHTTNGDPRTVQIATFGDLA